MKRFISTFGIIGLTWVSIPALAVKDATNLPKGCVATGTPGLTLDCNQNPIYALLQFLINKMFLILIPLAVLAIIISGIQYITSQGNPEGIKSAKSHLTNAIIGLILLILMGAILRFIGVPV